MKNTNRIFVLLLFGILWICKPIPYEDVVRNQLVRQEVLDLKGGSQYSTGRSSIGMKILLENLFPDWSERVDYQKKQEKFLQSGRKKLREGNRLRMKIKLTPQEQEAFDYFNGTGFSEKYQNPKTMEDPEVRTTFLNSYNNRYKKENWFNY